MYFGIHLIKVQEVHNHILCKVNLLSVLATNSPEANTIISFLCMFYRICENTFAKCTAYAVYLCVCVRMHVCFQE